MNKAKTDTIEITDTTGITGKSGEMSIPLEHVRLPRHMADQIYQQLAAEIKSEARSQMNYYKGIKDESVRKTLERSTILVVKHRLLEAHRTVYGNGTT